MSDLSLRVFFEKPVLSSQRQYEALRAYYLESLTGGEAAKRFGYSPSTFHGLVRRFRRGELVFFSVKKRGPKERRTSAVVRERIICLRRQNRSSLEIQGILGGEGVSVGVRTIERILNDCGFVRLSRRSRAERGLTGKNTLVPPKARQLDFAVMPDGVFSCQVAGVYLFLPYLLRMGVDDLIIDSRFPETAQLSRRNFLYSLLALKLIGQERFSQIDNYSFDRGFGFFAGLNVLPKSTAISTYSYRVDRRAINDFQKQFISRLNQMNPDYYNGETINLDFHTIPHYGEDPPLEKNWAGSKNKAMTGALTFLAQDGDSKMITYTKAEIDRADASTEILHFVDYWMDIKGLLDQTLVFDSKLTNYGVLAQLDQANVKFITLRRRGPKLIEKTLSIPADRWTPIKLDIPKRKYNTFLAYEHIIPLPNHDIKVREIIIRDHGRQQPTFIISNNFNLKIDTIIKCYAHRWRIENKISELIEFFKLNALSSPLMIRIHFDMLLTLIADTCYKLLANDLPRFQKLKAQTLFQKFINTPGKIHIKNNNVTVRLRKKATTPILKSNPVFQTTHEIPWWNQKKLTFDWHP